MLAVFNDGVLVVDAVLVVAVDLLRFKSGTTEIILSVVDLSEFLTEVFDVVEFVLSLSASIMTSTLSEEVALSSDGLVVFMNILTLSFRSVE